MRILVVADVEERLLYGSFKKERVEGVDLIIACGDLKAGYLDFLITMVNVPMVFVHGNHDDSFAENPPMGATSLEDTIFKFKGYNIAGLGGCMRYNRRGRNMYTEREMSWRCFRLWFKALFKGGVDILVTHAPVKGYGDLEDLPHRGYKCFDCFLKRVKPSYMFHGHIHTNYHRNIKTEYDHSSGTKIYNACGYKIIDLPDKE